MVSVTWDITPVSQFSVEFRYIENITLTKKSVLCQVMNRNHHYYPKSASSGIRGSCGAVGHIIPGFLNPVHDPLFT